MNPHRRDEHDSTTPRTAIERDINDDIGYKIRGAAQMSGSSVKPQPREESPPRYPHQDRRYRDSDSPSRRRSSSDYCYEQRSDSYDRYSARSNRPDSYRPDGYSRYGSRYRDWDNDGETRDCQRDRRHQGRGNGDYERSRAHFSQGYDDGHDNDPYTEPPQAPENTGEGDVSQDGKVVSFLVLRGLKSNTTEELLAKGLEKLYRDDSGQAQHDVIAPPGAPPEILTSTFANIPGAAHLAKPAAMPGALPGTLKRVFLIRDRETDKPMQYGFAEFHTTIDSKAALAKAELLGDKFTISSKKIKASYMDQGSFPPVIGPLSEDSKFAVQFKTGQMHKYRDERYYASARIVNSEPPAQPATNEPQKSKASKKRSNEAKALEMLDGSSEKKKKSKTSATSSLAAAQFWTQKQQELRGEDGGADENEESSTGPPSPSSANHGSVIEKEFVPQSFVHEGSSPHDGKRYRVCFLCWTKFPEDTILSRHVNESAMHAKNLDDEEVRNKALERMKEWGVKEYATIQVRRPEPEKTEKTEYRDRAKERRVLEAKAAAPEKLKVSLKDVGKKKGGAVESPGAEEKSVPSYGKGQTMLEKAGWNKGAGLGNGEGITAPIEQFTYAAGVGLGHEDGKKGGAVEEANRATRGDSGSFLEKTKDVARARFERM